MPSQPPNADRADQPAAGATVQARGQAGKCRIRRDPQRLDAGLDTSTVHVRAIRIAVETFCAEAGCDAESCGEIGLAVNEAIANIIRHAYDACGPMPIHLSATLGVGSVTIELRDWGAGRLPPDESEQARTHRVADQSSDPIACVWPGGLGLMCMRNLMDSVRFEPKSQGMILRMTRRFDRPARRV